MDTVYIIGASSLFNPLFAEYQQGIGWYYENYFKNFGAIRYSLDGTMVLLEEREENFLPEHLAHESIIIFRTDSESSAATKCKDYLATHKVEWESEDDLI